MSRKKQPGLERTNERENDQTNEKNEILHDKNNKQSRKKGQKGIGRIKII